MPVIMCSSLTQRGAKVTIEALTGGASDYVAKPSGQESREVAVRALARDLVPKIHALTSSIEVELQGRQQSFFRGGLRMPVAMPLAPRLKAQSITSTPTVLAIGVSTGGPAALDVLLPALPRAFRFRW